MSTKDVVDQLHLSAHLIGKKGGARHVGISRGPSGRAVAIIHAASVEEAHDLLDQLWLGLRQWEESGAESIVVEVTPERVASLGDDMISDVVELGPGDTHQ